MPLIALLLATVVIVAVSSIGRNPLQISRDWLFLTILAQAYIYGFVGPTFSVLDESVVLERAYASQQFLILALFFVPAILLYRALIRFRHKQVPKYVVLSIRPSASAAFLVGVLIFEIAFVYVSVENDFLFRRIGTEVLAKTQADLDLSTVALIRSHDLAIIPVIMLINFVRQNVAWSDVNTIKWKRLFDGLFVICVLVFLGYALLNSRLLIFVFLALLYWIRTLSDATRKSFHWKKWGGLVVVGVYFVLLVSNVRAAWPSGNISLAVLNPLYSIDDAETRLRAGSDWIKRADCLDLIVRIQSDLEQDGYARGAAWERPVVVLIGQFFLSEQAQELKRSARTTAKTYLLENYTTLDPGDYYSCAFTDAYGNFGPFGYLLLAICYTCAIGALTFAAHKTRKPWVIVLTFFFAAHLIVFESEFITLLLGWIRVAPFFILMLLVIPIAYIRRPAQV